MMRSGSEVGCDVSGVGNEAGLRAVKAEAGDDGGGMRYVRLRERECGPKTMVLASQVSQTSKRMMPLRPLCPPRRNNGEQLIIQTKCRSGPPRGRIVRKT
ncbi:uncharacterized protein A4U43_C07F28370 [Asparagus officinalis]|uniref:Uncharacterized protein n=1 Tax=Asparagus officinalis TaxID=4686 RepID=A0A5P1EFH6_ASPOF|nr:uncharacterized protein A4U43_C07F28370 [Asparagus officinalis]